MSNLNDKYYLPADRKRFYEALMHVMDAARVTLTNKRVRLAKIETGDRYETQHKDQLMQDFTIDITELDNALSTLMADSDVKEASPYEDLSNDEGRPICHVCKNDVKPDSCGFVHMTADDKPLCLRCIESGRA